MPKTEQTAERYQEQIRELKDTINSLEGQNRQQSKQAAAYQKSQAHSERAAAEHKAALGRLSEAEAANRELQAGAAERDKQAAKDADILEAARQLKDALSRLS